MTIRLRAVGEDDVPFLHRLLSDPDHTGVHQWYGWLNPHTLRRRWEEDGLLGDGGGMLIIADDDERAGLISWTKQITDVASFYWKMGLIVAPDLRGRGHGTRAQRLMVRYLFDHTTVNRIEASTEIDNIAEQRALEKAGFTREGVLRGAGFRAGRWRDGVLYGIIRADLDGDL